jgi:hypothetical protein
VLARKSYEKAYVDACRARFAQQLDHSFVHRMRGMEKGAAVLSDVRRLSEEDATLGRDEFVALSTEFLDAIEAKFPPD